MSKAKWNRHSYYVITSDAESKKAAITERYVWQHSLDPCFFMVAKLFDREETPFTLKFWRVSDLSRTSKHWTTKRGNAVERDWYLAEQKAKRMIHSIRFAQLEFGKEMPHEE
jgi:hypothetical protein